MAEMTALIPLHHLMASGRDSAHLVCHNGQDFVSWQAYSSSVTSLTHGLKLRPERRWLLTSSDALDFSIQLLALLHAGKQIIIPPNTQEGTLAQMAEEYDAVASSDLALSGRQFSVLPSLDPHATTIHLYTSGSTGKPKHVTKTLAQFEAEITVLDALWGNMLKDCAIVATVPHHHIYGLIFRILWPLSAGRLFDAAICAHPDRLQDRLFTFKKCALISSPAQLSRLPELVVLPEFLSNTHFIFSSGGPLSTDTASTFHQAIGFDPFEILGSTETGGIAWRRQCDDADWTPFSGVNVKHNDSGAMVLISAFLADLLPFTMDDAVKLLPGNKFKLLGRLDRVVKIEEKRLSLPEMEMLLTSHEWVKSAAATALSGRRQRVGMVVELSADGLWQLKNRGRRHVSQQLKQHLSVRFEAVLLPKHWRFLEQMPTNAQGKLPDAIISSLFATAELAQESRHVAS